MDSYIENILQKGVAAHAQGRLQAAKSLYHRVLKSYPRQPDANHNLGVMALAANDDSGALELFKTALEANSKIEQYWLSYIDTLIQTNNLAQAKEIVELAKKNVEFTEKLKIREAQLLALSVKEQSKSGGPSQSQLKELVDYYQSGRLSQAEKLATSFTQKFPEDQFCWKILGIILHQLGKKNASLEATQRSVKLSPEDTEALLNLGIILQDLGKYEEAENSYKKAILLKPEYPEAYNNLGNTLRALNLLDEAEDSFEKAIFLKPEFIEAYNNLGNLLYKRGRLEDAEEKFLQALKFAPDFAETHNNLGVVLKKMGRFEAAEPCFRQAIKLKSNYPEAYNNLANALQEQGSLEDAEIMYLKAVELKPDYADAHNNIGNARKELGKLDEAVSSFQQAFALRTGLLPKEVDPLAPATTDLYFELTNKCNFHCVFCPSDSQKRIIGSMDLELVKRLYDEASTKKIASKVNLHLMGEPTLHPDLIEILKYGATKKIKTDLVTNGSTLVAKNVTKILDVLYGTLIASHMTPTEDTYQFRGDVGLSWDRYIDNLRILVREYVKRRAKGEESHNDVKIRVMVTQNTASNVCINETEHEARAILQEWNNFVSEVEREEGIEPFLRKNHEARDLLRNNSQASISYHLQKGIQLTFWRAFTFANTRVDEGFELEPLEGAAYCPHPFTDVGVLWNGDVTLCCLDHDGELKIGNVQDASIEALISGDAAKELRASMLGERPLPPICQKCQAKPVRRQKRQD